MSKILVSKEADRLEIATILIKNGYTVRQFKVKEQGKKSYTYYIEYTKKEKEEQNE